MAARQKKGRPGDLRDMMIAGIVLAIVPRWRRATLATSRTFQSLWSMPGAFKSAREGFVEFTRVMTLGKVPMWYSQRRL